MAYRIPKLKQKGYTLIEMAVATAIMAVMATTVIMANRFVNKQGVINADQTFATEKAIQMYEELRALVNGNEQLGVGVLDNYSNGANFDQVLTTDTNVDTGASANPGDPLSGNIKSNGNWRYIRQVEVHPVANDAYARQVTVKVYLYPGDYAANNKTQPGTLLATVGGIMRTSAQPYIPTQVMDLYILDINNIPAWWAVLPTLSAYMQQDISDLSLRLSGLQLRTHYITRSSYGRDYSYQPETNSSAQPAETAPQSWVYFYPGFVPQDGSSTDNWYYDPGSNDSKSLLLTGNFMVDGVAQLVSNSQFSGVGNANYSVADQYNNAMRYPDELMAYQAVTTAAAAAAAEGITLSEGVTEISERMLMEGMLSQPASFENSMIINLHGELLPLPPLRNYSDAAKDPGDQMALGAAEQAGIPMTCAIAPTTLTGVTFVGGDTNVRVVTHPELIYYPGATNTSNSVTVRYRVYAYYDSEDTGGNLPPGDPRVPAISLFFPDAAATVVGVTAIVGNGSSPREYTYQVPNPAPSDTMPYNAAVPAGSDDPGAFPGPMSMTASITNNQTLITLYNTPLRAAQANLAATPSILGDEPTPNAIPEGGPCGTVAYASATDDTSTSTSPSFAYTVPTGSNFLLVQTNLQDTGSNAGIGNISYDGINLTQAVSFQWANGDLETWYLVNPPTNASHNILVTSNDSSGNRLNMGAISYSGVNTSNPIGTIKTQNDSATANLHTMNVTTTYANSLVACIVQEGNTVAFSEGAAQTSRWLETGGGDYTEADDRQTTTAGTSYPLTYTMSGGSSHSLGMEAVEIIASGCGPNTPTFTFTPTHTNTSAPTNTPTNTPTFTSTSTKTNTPTSTPTNTPHGAAPTATPTFTFTPLPTSTTTATPTPGSSGGLATGDMLYGSEYIPCAPDAQGGTALSQSSYVNNTYTFTQRDLTSTAKGSGYPKNTARWIISVAMPVTQVYTGSVTIMGTVYAAGTTVAGQHAIETRLGAGVTSSTINLSSGGTTTIYPNLSRTWIWDGDSFMPPYTEQYQFMGDPRDCPYYDVKFGGVSIAGAAITIGANSYNWWFKNGSTGEMAADGYVGFGASGANNSWNGNNVHIDLPRFYQIIRQGLLNTTSIWTTTNGWSFYYYGVGGEIGFDHSPLSNGVDIISAPFQTSMAGTVLEGYDSINGDGRHGSAPVTGEWVASNIKSSSANAVTWYQRSWLGELYPDSSYLSSWVSYGNLPSVANKLGLPETFFLQVKQNVAIPSTGGQSDDGFNNQQHFPNPGGNGTESFYNGQNPTTGKQFEHTGQNDDNSNEYNLGVTTYNIYPYPLANVVDVNRPWDFNGGAPPEWGMVPYSGMTTSLQNPSVTDSNTGGVTSRLFYDFNGQGSSSSQQGSGVIQMTAVNGGTTQIGYVVETGTAPAGSVGAQTLAETSLVYAMRTFLDGGQMAVTGAPGHIVQIPLVKIYPKSVVPQYAANDSIAVTVGSPVTATVAGQGAMSIGWPVTNIWWRFNPSGTANYYTEEYPNYGGAMTGTGLYQEATSVIYNLKYASASSNSNVTQWYFIQDGSAAVSGVCDNSAAHAITLTAPWTYNWPVASGGTTLAQGDYLLMVEAYRQGFAEHYAFDIYNFQISW